MIKLHHMIRELPTLFELAKTLNFSATARSLKLSQSAVSRQIASVERQLGYALFVRDRHHGVRLTPKGQQLLTQLQPAFDVLQRALSPESAAVQELIRVGSMREIGIHRVTPLLTEFQRAHPGIRMEVRLQSGAEVIEAVKRGELECGFVSESVELETVRSYPFLDETLVLVGPEVVDDLSKRVRSLPLVAYRSGDAGLLRFLRQVNSRLTWADLDVRLSVDSFEAVLAACESLGAYAVVPRHLMGRTALKRANPLEFTGKIYRIHRVEAYEQPGLKALKTFLKTADQSATARAWMNE